MSFLFDFEGPTMNVRHEVAARAGTRATRRSNAQSAVGVKAA